MRRNSFSKFWIFITVNLWYIPFLALLFGIKLSLISYLVSNTVQNRDYKNHHLTNEIIKIIELRSQEQKQLKPGRKPTRYSTSTPLPRRNSLTADDLKNLASIENAVILPSAANRTDSQGLWLVFNHVPWGGGEVLSALLENLQRDNNFKHTEHEYRTPWPRFLLEEEQQSLVRWFEYQHLAASYDRHFYFVNFTKHQQRYILGYPIYVNIVQNPASRLLAAFQWKRQTNNKALVEIKRLNRQQPGSGSAWFNLTFDDCVLKSLPECSYESGSQDFTMVVPFFCGQFNSCVTISSKWALQTAKFNIEKYYSVVGVLESLDDTLMVLEGYIPRFFTGSKNYEVVKPSIYNVSPEVLRVLRRKLPYEFELYSFIQQRLQLQLISMSASSPTATKPTRELMAA